MQHQAAREVAAALDGRDAGGNRGRGSGEEASVRGGGVVLAVVGAAEPGLFFGGEVDGAGEGFGPLEVGGVEVRVRDDDGFEAAFRVYLVGWSGTCSWPACGS